MRAFRSALLMIALSVACQDEPAPPASASPSSSAPAPAATAPAHAPALRARFGGHLAPLPNDAGLVEWRLFPTDRRIAIWLTIPEKGSLGEVRQVQATLVSPQGPLVLPMQPGTGLADTPDYVAPWPQDRHPEPEGVLRLMTDARGYAVPLTTRTAPSAFELEGRP